MNIDTVDKGDIPGAFRIDDEISPPPTAILGRLPKQTVLALEIRDRGGRSVLGGERVSTRLDASRTIAGDVALSRLRSSDVRAFRADYLSLGHWAGMRPPEGEWHISLRTQG